MNGQEISYRLTTKNLGPGDYEAGYAYLYINIPANTAYVSTEIDTGGNYDCNDYGPVGDMIPTVYTGNLVICSIEVGPVVSTGAEFTLNLHLTTTNDFVVGEDTLRAALFAEDTDSGAIEATFDSGDEPFDVENNNLVSLVYGVNDEKPASTDSDSVPDEVEDAGPNSGDGNNDGILDSKQNNVASLPDPKTSKYVTLVTTSGSTISSAAIVAENVKSKSNNDTGYNYPMGLVSFTLTGVAPGSTNDITLYYSDPADTNVESYTLRKHNPGNKDVFTIEGYELNQTSINDVTTITAKYQVKDGGKLDIDAQINGVIVDPVGLAVKDTTPGVLSALLGANNPLAATGQALRARTTSSSLDS